MKIINTKILSVKNLSGDNFQITFQANEIAADAIPGQFIEIPTGGATLLNKPISISDVLVEEMSMTVHQEHIISLVIKNIGAGTKAISEFMPGDKIKIIGPCGNGFPIPEMEAILVGGGVGIPPLYFMAKYYSNTHFTVIIGAGTINDIVLEDELKALENVDVILTTDDGSKGSKGTVIPELKKILDKKKSIIYTCGPKPMLAAIAKIGAEIDTPVYASLEAYMGCGIGVCMGCVVPTVRGMERVCKEGPVFLAENILWEEI
ncbi:dihydroorotate dehydrogenase electron transfer subunit [bacterium]|nr:dihydroorotate dehydrogenase electron transfer subunit [bacterium]